MNFQTWEPVYEAILADMGYDRRGDERARDRLAELVAGDATLDPQPDAFAGETVTVAAPGPDLLADRGVLADADTVVAAGVAADRLREADEAVDWVVTDLDGHPEGVGGFTTAEIPVCLHAHGDNVDRVDRQVPACDPEFVLPTTQAEPVDGVSNFGGFTDGDRAAFFADALGADRIRFAGWAFDDPTVSEEKRRKLRWARWLLAWLEDRRDDRFAVLDGHRDAVDLSTYPGTDDGEPDGDGSNDGEPDGEGSNDGEPDGPT